MPQATLLVPQATLLVPQATLLRLEAALPEEPLVQLATVAPTEGLAAGMRPGPLGDGCRGGR